MSSPNQVVSPEALAQIFTEARSHHAWQQKAVSEETLRQLYEVTKWGPTSVNASPARFVFVQSEEAKNKLAGTVMGSNVEQIKSAPVTVIIAWDEKFYDQLPKLFPVMDVRPMFTSNPQLSYDTAFRNSSLQGAYLILAARALGLDVCPMSGFDNAKVDAAFFKGTTYKSNFICTLGYGDASKLYPRGPRLGFEEAAKIL